MSGSRGIVKGLGKYVLLVALLMGALTACGGAQETATTAPAIATEPQAEEPTAPTEAAPMQEEEGAGKQGGDLRIVWAVDVALFDPATSGRGLARGIMSAVLQGLTQINPETGVVEPLLATQWEASEDELTWTFHLQEGIDFQDGTPFNADTVVANVERWLDPDFTHVTRSRLEAIEEVTAKDEYTVEFTLSRPYPALPNTMGEGFHYMLSQSDIEEYYLELGQHLPAGTGPFKVVEFVPRERIVMERWDDYKGPRADEVYLDRIIADTVPDDSARTARLLAGEADINLYQSLLDVDRIEADSNLENLRAPSLRQWHFYINRHQPQVSDVKVRQALNHAVDQDALVRVVMQGNATPRWAIIPEAHFGAIQMDPIYEYNPDKALDLMEEAGWTMGDDGLLRDDDGNVLSVSMAHTTGGVYVGDQDIASAVAGYWRAIGVEVEELPMDRGTFYGTVPSEGALESNEIVAVPFQISFQDGAAFLDLTSTERSMPPACCNFAGYDNPDTWAIIELALAASDPAERAELIEEASRLLWTDVPVVPGPQLQLIAGKVKNLHTSLSPNELHPIAFAWFEEMP